MASTKPTNTQDDLRSALAAVGLVGEPAKDPLEAESAETAEILKQIYAGTFERSQEDVEAILRAAVHAFGNDGKGDTGRILAIVGNTIEDDFNRSYAELMAEANPAWKPMVDEYPPSAIEIGEKLRKPEAVA
jgi:hypothetical protein